MTMIDGIAERPIRFCCSTLFGTEHKDTCAEQDIITGDERAWLQQQAGVIEPNESDRSADRAEGEGLFGKLEAKVDKQREGTLGEVIDRRVQVYGDPVESFPRVAQVWSGLLGFEVDAWQVPLLMAAYKMVRIQYAPDYQDNSDDVDGYMDIFRKLIGDDMVEARSVEEFIAKKWGR